MTIPITYKSTMQTHKMNLLGDEVANFQAELKKTGQSGNKAAMKKVQQKQTNFNVKHGITGTRFRLKKQNHLVKRGELSPIQI